jgi:hypothetical protein
MKTKGFAKDSPGSENELGKARPHGLLGERGHGLDPFAANA